MDWSGPMPAGVVSYLLVSMRMAGLLLLAPPFSSLAVPVLVRGAFVLGLSAALWPAHGGTLAGALPWSTLATWAVLEFATGALMALGVNIGFAAFAIGARILDVQIGFGIGQVLDPATRQRMPVLSAAFVLLAPVLFVLADCHHVMLRAMARGLERFPLGTTWSAEAASQAVWPLVQGMFTLGLAMVAPIVFCLVLVELALGVVSRNLPQMNVFILGIPIKVLSGLAALGAWMAAATAPMTRVFDAIFRSWDAALR
jgi:flagellar biosynthetic protein FliR